MTHPGRSPTGATPLTAATRGALGLLAALALALAAACEPAEDRSLPSIAVLDSIYGEAVETSLNGNVVELRITQDASQLTRGGPIWAKAGPYIYLFTPQTRSIFERFGGVGGVRATTLDSRGELVARALLERSSLNSVTWPKAINVAGRARTQGSERPQRMVDLAEFGEEHTDYEYSQSYVRRD